MEQRKAIKVQRGVVVSDHGDKTIRVEVQWMYKHPQYGKYLRRSTKFGVHDEKNEAHIGDKVRICETRPLSKDKRWRLAEIISKAKIVESPNDI